MLVHVRGNEAAGAGHCAMLWAGWEPQERLWSRTVTKPLPRLIQAGPRLGKSKFCLDVFIPIFIFSNAKAQKVGEVR